MPSKLLIAAAHAAHRARNVQQLGVRTDGVRIDGRKVMGRVRSERDRFVGFVLDVIEEARAAGELVVGRGTVVSPGLLEVGDGKKVQFERLVVATGGKPFIPPPFRNLDHALLTNETIFELEDLPDSVLVVGIGVIGLELGQALHRLDVRTTLLGIEGLLGPLSDPVVLADARETLRKELDLHTNYRLESIEVAEAGVRVRFIDSEGKKRDEKYERVLVAAGQKTNLDQLGLRNMGIEPNADGRYEVDPDTLQLSGAPVFVAGDANQLHPVLHEAADDGRIAGRNAALYPEIKAAWRRTPLGIVFSEPQIGVIGGGYKALADCEAVAGEVSYVNQGRARVQGVNAGRVRVYAHVHTGRLLGAELFGPEVEHLSHLLAWAVQAKLTVEQALEMPFYHPVVEEGLRTALRDLNANLRHGAPIKCPVTEMGVGS
jgi:dihydrolipoamide dehydrogenase